MNSTPPAASPAGFPDTPERRSAAVAAVRRMDALGMNRGSTGNLSLRVDGSGAHGGQGGMLVTPTGMGADDLQPQDLVWVGWDGSVDGAWQPSSEWHFHRAIYRSRPELNAVLHTHSTHAAALASLDRPLPAFHYMVAIAGGDHVPLVPYHLFGTEALSQGVAAAMVDIDACLLAHHGLIAAGPTLARAMKVLQEVESLCEVYLKALAVAEPALLSRQQMAEVIAKFSRYGRSARRDQPPA